MQRRCVSRQRCAVQGGEQEQILCPIFFADQAALLGVRLRWTTTAEGGRREEVESDVSALAKLGEAMTDTALAILMAGIAASHLCIHNRERDNDDDGCYDNDDDDDEDNKGGGGSPWRVLADAAAAAPHPGKEGKGGGGGGMR